MSSNRNFWKEEEIQIMKNNYEKYGAKYCSKLINRTVQACRKKAIKLNLIYDNKQRYHQQEFSEIVKRSYSYADICRELKLTYSYGYNHTIRKYIKLYNLDISHFKIDYSGKTFHHKIDLKNILVDNSVYDNSNHLKNRLYKEGLKKRICELCGQKEEWRGKHMSLILDHINGNRYDNRIENLRIVCPNCNATLDTHCRGYKKIEKKQQNLSNNIKEIKIKDKNKIEQIKIYKIYKYKKCECGNDILITSTYCSKCSHEKNRKVRYRPTIEQLEQDIKELGYCGTGRKYGVSDNAIRKWLKNYK